MKTIIGLMGPGDNATQDQIKQAYELGARIAREDWFLLTGGRDKGIMEAASRGAKENNGLTIGILPENDRSQMSSAIDVPIITGMGNARNCINILSSDVVVICGIGAGTLSEAAIAIKTNTPLICYRLNEEWINMFRRLEPNIYVGKTTDECIQIIKDIIA